jgi:hypothetical protein
MKPIETEYNGCRFRSRVEARWAVFFDSLSIRWEYEREGFDLGDLGGYLPDFFLPDYEMFVEIKPFEAPFLPRYETALAKIEALSAAKKKCMLICGSPGVDTYFIPDFVLPNTKAVFALDRKCNCLVVIGDYGQDPLRCFTCPDPDLCGEKQTVEHYSLDRAYRDARYARFESKSRLHGVGN